MNVIDTLLCGDCSSRIASPNAQMDKSIDPFYQNSVLELQSRVGKVDVAFNELPKLNINGDTNEVMKATDTKDAKASRRFR